MVIPDSSPLISLALGHSLDLLLKMNIPIRLVDVVLDETIGHSEKPGVADIRRFVEDNSHSVEVVETVIGRLIREKIEREPGFRGKNLGEAAIAEFLSNLDDYIPGNDPVLVLFEDAKAERKQIYLHGRAHLLTTMSLLDGMEEIGLIPSAQQIVQTIRRAGRTISFNKLDRSAPIVSGGSYWKPVF